MLTPTDIARMAAAGESMELEFKGESRGALPDAEIVLAVVCLANADGGWLLLGVEDDGTITGAQPRHEQGGLDPRRVEALISGKTRPALSVRVQVVATQHGPVVAIQVPNSRAPIANSDGRYVRRTLDARGKPACLPYFAWEMGSIGAAFGVPDPTLAIVSGATWDDLDPLEFDRLRRLIRESKGRGDDALLELSNREIAKSLGAVEANGEVRHIRLLGLLLFGHEAALRRMLPAHEVAFQELDGTAVRVNDFFRWPLLRAFDDLVTRFAHRVRHVELMVGMHRVDVPDYPEPAFREAVANALVHRDYATLGAVHVQWRADQLRVDSPGGFPEGVRLDNLLVTPPRPRNPFLADAFKRAGLVERTGRGIDSIFESQLRNGRPAPSYALSGPANVTVVLHGGPANLDFVRFAVEEARQARPLSLADLLLVNELHLRRSLAAPDAAALLQCGDAEARSALARLVERGLCEARGGRHRVWHLSAAAYRAMGDEAGHLRTRGFEPLQHEQMVLRYIKLHGQIRRAQAAELCQVSVKQAEYLLTELAQRGEITLVHAGRISHYLLSRDSSVE